MRLIAPRRGSSEKLMAQCNAMKAARTVVHALNNFVSTQKNRLVI